MLKPLILDKTHKTFVGCSAGFRDLVRNSAKSNLDQLDFDMARCSEGGGTYETTPYLLFADPASIQAENKEWAYDNDAPSFSLLRYARDTRTTSEDSMEPTILSRSALTKRKYPSVLKVCSNEVDVSHTSLETPDDGADRSAVQIQDRHRQDHPSIVLVLRALELRLGCV
jgi:hypothetical protein